MECFQNSICSLLKRFLPVAAAIAVLSGIADPAFAGKADSTGVTADAARILLNCTAGAVGTVCADGSVYAGISPDGNVPMYVQRCDYSQTWNGRICIYQSKSRGAKRSLTWNDGSNKWVDTPLVNCDSADACDNSGETNTATLTATDSSTDAGFQPHAAAAYCNGLAENGHDDWYLPSAPELKVIYANKAAIKNFNVSGQPYWSSSENVVLYAWQMSGEDNQNPVYKTNEQFVRCARR
ncbi:MAG: DUF1566 domain-containing protein [Pseudomonadota bacterium]